MVRPTLSTASSSPSSISADVLVVGVRPGADGGPAALAAPATGSVDALDGLDLAAIGATGAKDQLVRIPATGIDAASIALIGLGSGTDAAAVRSAAGSAVRQLPQVASIALALPTDTTELVDAALEGAALGAYAFTRHKGAGTTTPARGSQTVTVLAPDSVAADATVRPAIVADAAALVRDLVNTAAGDLGPADVASVATDLAEGLPLTVEVLDETELEAQGFGGILGVGRRLRPSAAPGRRPVRAGDRDEAPRARRQGHHVRLGRALAQAGRVDARHEDGHDRCRDRARHHRGRRPTGTRRQGDGVAVPGREHAVGLGDAPR